jgi:glycosyltransferase involved in cell wall biosynthesis
MKKLYGEPTARLDALFVMYSGFPEPPTLNALALCQIKGLKTVLLRGNLDFSVENYLLPTEIIEVGAQLDIRQFEAASTIKKTARFMNFCWKLAFFLLSERPKILLLHDHLSLFAFYLIAPFVRFRGLVWHNSYDTIDGDAHNLKRFSLIGQLFAHYKSAFARVDVFTLPSAERKCFYPVDQVKNTTEVIPNYPARFFYDRFYTPKPRPQQTLELIYQGALGPGHGFEELLDIMSEPVADCRLRLTLKGWVRDAFKAKIDLAALARGQAGQLRWVDFGPYSSVPEVAAQCHIGIAIFTGQDVMNRTLGTASNKIYEYAALGLPVLMFDAPHFREVLGQRDWVYFTDLTPASLRACLTEMVLNYQKLSALARADFENGLNFEQVFMPVLEEVLSQVAQPT